MKVKARLAIKNSPIEIRSLVYNEYYYHLGQYLKQYLLGRKHLKLGYNGNFSAGVGSSCLALELFKKGKISQAQEYAFTSLDIGRVIKKMPSRWVVCFMWWFCGC